jgi:hypothetical protein
MMRRTTQFFHYLFGDSRSARFRRPMHRTLSPLLQLPQFLDKRFGFVTAQARNRYTFIKSRFIRQVVSHGAKHVGMTVNVLRDTQAEMFFIFEHKAEYSLPMYLLLFLKRTPVFFFVHDMQQCAARHLRSRIALNICRTFVRFGEFYPVFIALNDADLDEKTRFLSTKTLTIPHPHHLAAQPAPTRPVRTPGTRLRVGIIETTRKEKSIRHLLDILRKTQKSVDFQLVVGAPLRKQQKPSWLNDPHLEILDTTTEAQFSQYLRGLDIFVADFIKAEYYFRPSGAIVDAGMNGCYIVCPDFPVFRAQIDIPVSIGSTFAHSEEIPEVLKKSIEKLQTKTVDFETWRQYHRVENIASQFKTFLQQRVRG